MKSRALIISPPRVMLHGACMGLVPGLDPGVDCMHCRTGAYTALVCTCMVIMIIQ